MTAYCNNCGRPEPGSARFCAHCGGALLRGSPPAAPPPVFNITQQVIVGGQKKNSGWGCGLILLLMASCCIWSKMKDGCDYHSDPPPPAPVVNSPSPLPVPEPEKSHPAEYEAVLTFLGTPKGHPRVRGVLNLTTAGVESKEMIDIAYDGRELVRRSFRADSFSLYLAIRGPDKVSVVVSRDGRACGSATLMEATPECLLNDRR
jgi:hypothetical protein